MKKTDKNKKTATEALNLISHHHNHHKEHQALTRGILLSEDKLNIYRSLLNLTRIFFASKNFSQKRPFKALTLPDTSWLFERDLMILFPYIHITALEKDPVIYRHALLNMPPAPDKISYILSSDKEFISNPQNRKSFQLIWLNYSSPFSLTTINIICKLAMDFICSPSILAFTFISAFDSFLYPLYQQIKPFSKSPDRTYIIPKIVKDILSFYSHVSSVKLIKLYRDRENTTPVLFTAFITQPHDNHPRKLHHKQPSWWNTYLELKIASRREIYIEESHSMQNAQILAECQIPEDIPQDIKESLHSFYQILNNFQLNIYQQRAIKACITRFLNSKQYHELQCFTAKILTKYLSRPDLTISNQPAILSP